MPRATLVDSEGTLAVVALSGTRSQFPTNHGEALHLQRSETGAEE